MRTIGVAFASAELNSPRNAPAREIAPSELTPSTTRMAWVASWVASLPTWTTASAGRNGVCPRCSVLGGPPGFGIPPKVVASPWASGPVGNAVAQVVSQVLRTTEISALHFQLSTIRTSYVF